MSNLGNHNSIETKRKKSIAMTKFTDKFLIEQATNYLIQSKLDQKMPTLSALALACGCSKSTLLDHARTSEALANLLTQLQLEQEQVLIETGLTTKNPTFSIFMLKTKHDYTEQPTQLTQNNTFSISPDLLADAIAVMKKDPK